MTSQQTTLANVDRSWGLKDSGHNQDIKLAAAISSKRVKEGKFLKDTASIETHREVRKFSLETYMYTN